MSSAPARHPAGAFSASARKFIRSLHDSFLRDEGLVDDLDAVLGASAGPMGLAGAKHRTKPRRRLFRSTTSTPSSSTAAMLGCAVTRLDRMLGRLVTIAQEREWEPPFPNVAEPVARASALRSHYPWPTGEFAADQAHLRLLAMAAVDLLDVLSDDEPEEALAIGARLAGEREPGMKYLPRTYWCHADRCGIRAALVPLNDVTTDSPGLAVEWVRESVREVSASLDRHTFHAVWGWLGDHRAVQAAVVALRRGEPYTFTVASRSEWWIWTAYPVSALPLVSTCPSRL